MSGTPLCNGVLGRMWHLHPTAPPLSPIYNLHSALCNVQFTLCRSDCALCSLHCARCSVYCALCSVHFDLCTVHCKCTQPIYQVNSVASHCKSIVSDGGSALGGDRSTLESASLSHTLNQIEKCSRAAAVQCRMNQECFAVHMQTAKYSLQYM